MPSCSVIIPTYNGARKLRATLEAVLAQDAAEVIVVDDGSTDGTESVVGDLRAGWPALHYVRQLNSGPAAARNRGAAAAAGDVLLFLDDDIVVHDGAVARHLAHHDDRRCFVVGRILQPAQILETPFGRYRNERWEEFHRSHHPERLSPTDGMSAANLSVRRSDFLDLGGFDEDFTIASSEDWELGFRARSTGIEVLYDPLAVATHEDWADSLERFCERQRLYSVSDVLLVQKYGERSPRAALVDQARPVQWRRDPPARTARMLVKQALATRPGRRAVVGGVAVAERFLASAPVLARTYDVAIAVAIHAGVREGLRRFRPRTILHLIDAAGATAYFTEIASGTSDRFRPVVGSVAPAGSLQASMEALGVDTFSLGAAHRRAYLRALLSLCRAVIAHDAAIVHAHCFDPAVLGFVAARLTRRPFVLTRHHSDHNFRLGKRWHVRVDSFVGCRADKVIAVSDATKTLMKEHEGVPGENVVVVYNGARPIPSVDAATISRTRAGLDIGDAPVALTTARLHEEKGIADLLAAIVDVRMAHPDLVFLIAGAGPDRGDLERRAAELGVSGSVRFLNFRSDVPALLHIAAVFVHPARAESFGFSVLEAMSVGIPIVSTSAGGLGEVTGDAAIMVPSGDPVRLAEAVVRVLDDERLREQLRLAGRERAPRFGVEAMLRGYESVYDGVLSKSGRQ